MPYAVVPPIVIMVGAFTVGGLGLGLGNYLKYDGIRKKRGRLEDWDHMMDERDMRLRQSKSNNIAN